LSDPTFPASGLPPCRRTFGGRRGRTPLPSAPRNEARPRSDRRPTARRLPPSRRHTPQARALDVSQIAGEIRDDGDREVLDSARGRTAHGGVTRTEP
jgi:hypothetical protein